MGEFEFSRFVTVGQYLPTGSIIHRLDARVRLLCGGAILLSITLTQDFAGLFLALGAVLVALRGARVPLRYALRGVLPPLPFLLFLALLQVLFGPPVETAGWTFGPVHISAISLMNGLLLCVRFGTLILALSLTSFCISTTELVRGLEALLKPLTAIGVPTHDFVLMVQVALHFLPLLAHEAERIAKAQASRGAAWGTGRGGLLQRTRQVLPLLIPLFLTSLQRAENLALAMEARGYQGGKGRTSMIEMHFHLGDAVALGAVFILTLAVVVI